MKSIIALSTEPKMSCENEAVSLVLQVNVIDPTNDSLDNAQRKWLGRTLRYYFQFCPNGDEQLNAKSLGLRGGSPRHTYSYLSGELLRATVTA